MANINASTLRIGSNDLILQDAAARASMAPAYSASSTYAVGDIVLKDGQLYECTTAISTAEAWTAAHWTAVTVGGELTDLKEDLNDISFELYGMTPFELEQGSVHETTGATFDSPNFIRSTPFRVGANQKYNITVTNSKDARLSFKIFYYDGSGTYLSVSTIGWATVGTTNWQVTTPQNTGYIRLRFSYQTAIPIDTDNLVINVLGQDAWKNGSVIAYVSNQNAIDTTIGYDRFFTMPYLYNFSKRQIDFDNGTISFASSNTILSPYKYYQIQEQSVTFGTDDFVYWFVYNYETGTISSVKNGYSGKELVLFGLYRQRIISPYTGYYDNALSALSFGYLGDSITYGVGAGGNTGAYPELIRKHYRTTVNNYGVSGSAITEEPGVTTDSFNERVEGMTSGLDIVCFMGGTNDYWRNLHKGSITDTVNTTLYGALNNLCEALQTKYPNAFIYAVVPPMGYAPDNNFTMEAKSNIGSFLDVRTVIKEVCNKYAIPVLDFMVESSMNPKIQSVNTTFYSDGVHLNKAGQKVLAEAHIDFLSKHIKQIQARVQK